MRKFIESKNKNLVLTILTVFIMGILVLGAFLGMLAPNVIFIIAALCVLVAVSIVLANWLYIGLTSK